MTSISIGTLQISSQKWLALALELGTGALVACTSSDSSPMNATQSLSSALRRLNRLKEFDKIQHSPKISQIGSRLVELYQGNGRPFFINEISQRNWSLARSTISKRLLEVPRGKVISYGGLAKLSNSSPRGVGSIMRSNPVPWAVPCHRVIHSDGRLGKLGGTISGTKEKARILRAEGVQFNNDGTVNDEAIVS